MTQDELLSGMGETFDACLQTARRKNADYAGLGNDAFANFRVVEHILSNMTAERGILVRLTDKLKRLDNLVSQDAQVADESFEDTCEDAINYLAILKQLRRSRRLTT